MHIRILQYERVGRKQRGYYFWTRTQYHYAVRALFGCCDVQRTIFLAQVTAIR